MKLPTFKESEFRCKAGEETPLERFIFEYEPIAPGDEPFREDLRRLLLDIQTQQNERLQAQLARLAEMEYALEAGNTERSKIDPEVLRVWLHYVRTGERDMPGIGYLVTLEASE